MTTKVMNGFGFVSRFQKTQMNINGSNNSISSSFKQKTYTSSFTSSTSSNTSSNTSSKLINKSKTDVNISIPPHDKIEQYPSYLHELKIYSILPEIIKSINDNQVTVCNAGTGSGKTVGIPRAMIPYLVKNQMRMLVSVPTVLNVIFQHDYAIKQNPELADAYAYAYGGKKSANFHVAPVSYGTTQSIINYIIDLHQTSRETISKLIITIDEAHAPSSENYCLHALCNWMISQGIQIKVVIMTATPTNYGFDKLVAEPIVMSDTQYPVTTHWHPIDLIEYNNVTEHTDFNGRNMIEAVIAKISEVKQYPGDILIFMSGETGVEEVCEKIRKKYSNFDVYPIYSNLPEDEIKMIATFSLNRKVIIATNYAESGVTIPGIQIVIDTLLHKKMISKPGGNRILDEVAISQSSSIQRAGRAGRTGPGHYFPLCTQDGYEQLRKHYDNDFMHTPKHIPVLSFLARELPANDILRIEKNEYDSIIQDLIKWKLIRQISRNPFMLQYKCTYLGFNASKYPLSINSSIVMLNAKNHYNVTLEDFKNRNDNFYGLLQVLIAVVTAEARLSSPMMFYIPPEYRKRIERTKYIHHMGIYDEYKDSDDLSVLINIFTTMMQKSLDESSGKIYHNDWCYNAKFLSKFIELCIRLFNQVWYLVFPFGDDSNMMYISDFDITKYPSTLEDKKQLYRFFKIGYNNHNYKMLINFNDDDKIEYVHTNNNGTRSIGIADRNSLVNSSSLPQHIIALGMTTITIEKVKKFSVDRFQLSILNVCFPDPDVKEDVIDENYYGWGSTCNDSSTKWTYDLLDELLDDSLNVSFAILFGESPNNFIHDDLSLIWDNSGPYESYF